MSGGKFLVGLYDILQSEKAIKILTLFKYCEYSDLSDLKAVPFVDEEKVQEVVTTVDIGGVPPLGEEVEEVVLYIAGYVTSLDGLILFLKELSVLVREF